MVNTISSRAVMVMSTFSYIFIQGGLALLSILRRVDLVLQQMLGSVILQPMLQM